MRAVSLPRKARQAVPFEFASAETSASYPRCGKVLLSNTFSTSLKLDHVSVHCDLPPRAAIARCQSTKLRNIGTLHIPKGYILKE